VWFTLTAASLTFIKSNTVESEEREKEDEKKGLKHTHTHTHRAYSRNMAIVSQFTCCACAYPFLILAEVFWRYYIAAAAVGSWVETDDDNNNNSNSNKPKAMVKAKKGGKEESFLAFRL